MRTMNAKINTKRMKRIVLKITSDMFSSKCFSHKIVCKISIIRFQTLMAFNSGNDFCFDLNLEKIKYFFASNSQITRNFVLNPILTSLSVTPEIIRNYFESPIVYNLI